MDKITSSPYADYGFMVARCPLLPLYPITDGRRTSCIADDDDYSSLFRKFSHPLFGEALQLSSADLYKEYLKIRDSRDPDKNKAVLQKLISYFLRMSARPTPYGISAGVGLVDLADRTTVTLAANHRKKTIPNFDLTTTLAAEKMSDPGFTRRQRYFTNNSLFTNNRGFNYTRTSGRSFVRSTLPYSEIIAKLLSFSVSGKHYEELSGYLSSMGGVSAIICAQLIDKLVEKELLIPAIWPRIFQRETAAGRCENPDPFLAEIDNYDQLPLGRGSDMLHKLYTTYPDVDAEKLHTIAGLNFSANTVHRRVAEDLGSLTWFLHRLRGTVGHAHLTRFCEEFSHRYGSKEIPLTEALDEQFGIGYPVPDKPFIRSRYTASLKKYDSTAAEGPDAQWDQFLLEKLSGYAKKADTSGIELTDDDLSFNSHPLGAGDLSPSVYCLFSILASSEDAITRGEYTIDFSYAGGPSSINALNRFSWLDDELYNRLKECADWENACHRSRGYALAEINFLPRSGIGGNILKRSNFREYEIPVFTEPDRSKHSFDLNGISLFCADGKLIAKDRITGMKILPSATVLYDNHNTASVNFNAFLTDLGEQDKVNNLEWSWGSLSGILDHFPRVRYRNCILSKEMWRFTATGLREISAGKEPSIEDLRKLLRSRKLPGMVNYLEKTDQLLLLNLKNKISLEILLGKIEKNGAVLLSETLFSEHTCIVNSPSGLHAHQFILPLHLSDCHLKEQGPDGGGHPLSANEITECQTPCWTVTLFCSPALMDEALLGLSSLEGFNIVDYKRIDRPRSLQLLLRAAPSGVPAAAPANGDAPEQLKKWLNEYPASQKVISQGPHGEEPALAMTLLSIELIRLSRQRTGLTEYDFRLLSLILVSVRILKIAYENETDRKPCISWLYAKAAKTAQRDQDPPDKKILSNAYRQILNDLQTHASIVKEISSIAENRLSKPSVLRTMLPGGDAAGRYDATGSLLADLANKLMYSGLQTSESLLLFDFIGQYFKQEEFIVRYRNIAV